MTRIKRLLDNGYLKERVADVMGGLGSGLTWATAYFFEEWEGFWFWLLMCIGVILGYTAAYGGLARKMGIPPPFTNDPLGWRKAKDTYKSEDDTVKASPQGIFGKLARWFKR